MTVRTRRETVVFRSPFSIRGVDGAQPAGAYTIETEEELVEPLSFTAYHRLSTAIVIPLGKNSHQIVRIDPAELAAAQQREATSETPGS